MATRAVKLKLSLNRGEAPDATADRDALWTLHAATNRAVAAYEERLLEFRQGDVCLLNARGEEFIRPADEWRTALLRHLQERGVDRENYEVAAEGLKGIYCDLVKSYDTPNSGSSQDAGRWHSALCSPESNAGEQKYLLLERWGWLVEEPVPPGDWRERVLQDQGELEAFTLTGSPPAWRRRLLKGDATWPDALLADLQKKKVEADNDLGRRLRAVGALPIIDPVIKISEGKNSKGDLNLFERSAMALAIAHLNQWESWRHRVEQQREALERRLRDADAKGERFHDVLPKLRAFEEARSERIAADAMWSDGSVYHLTARELRGWDRLREWLRGNPNATAEERAAFVKTLQGRARGRFGAAEVLIWLAEPEQADLALHPDGDPVLWLATRNALVKRLEGARQLPRFTFADARKHPRFVELDAPKNSNKPPYQLKTGADGRLYVTIPGLEPAGAGYRVREVRAALAPSGQVRGVELEPGERRKEQRLSFRSQDNLDRTGGTLGGAALIFERSEVGQAKGSAHFGRLYIKLALDFSECAELFGENSRHASYLKGAQITRAKRDTHPTDLRVLGVDLGLRSAAACAVYGWRGPGEPASHERSFLLRLPGEAPGPDELARRSQAGEALGRAKGAVGRLRTLASLARLDEAQRSAAIERLRDGWPPDAPPLPATAHRAAAIAAWQAAEVLAGKAIHDLVALHREQRISRGAAPTGGKGAWRLEHLDRTLRLLRGWDRRQHPEDTEVKRFDRAKAGTVGRRLFEHLTALREDRVKTVADLIVQAARGRVRQGGRWEQRFAPVNVIVLEDLARYRFRTDRPPRENSQLMRWSHRALAEQVAMQAEVFGIAVDEAPAEFSSRFDATTGSPGVRCHRLTKDDLDGLAILGDQHWLVRRLGDPAMLTTLKGLTPGALIPTGDGEHLVFPTRGKGLSVKHADINAAQNVAIRYLTAFSQPVRVVAFEVKGSEGQRLAIQSVGKRLQAYLEGTCALLEQDPDGGYRARGLRGVRDLQKQAGGELAQHEGTSVAEDEDDAQLAEELQASLSERKVLFRDRSGSIFPPDRWFETKEFWGRVVGVVGSRLKNAGYRINAARHP